MHIHTHPTPKHNTYTCHGRTNGQVQCVTVGIAHFVVAGVVSELHFEAGALLAVAWSTMVLSGAFVFKMDGLSNEGAMSGAALWENDGMARVALPS